MNEKAVQHVFSLGGGEEAKVMKYFWDAEKARTLLKFKCKLFIQLIFLTEKVKAKRKLDAE